MMQDMIFSRVHFTKVGKLLVSTPPHVEATTHDVEIQPTYSFCFLIHTLIRRKLSYLTHAPSVTHPHW